MRNLHIVTGDWHIPFHNKKLVNGMLELISDLGNKLDSFNIIGDFMDLNSLSFHDRGKIPIKGIDLGTEYKQGNKILDRLDSVIDSKTKKRYLWGNHESRATRHLATADGAKLGIDLLSPTRQLSLLERGYEVKENWQEDHFRLGKHLELVHGQFTNIHVAKKHLDTYKTSIIMGHSHRVQVFAEGGMIAYNIGHFADESTPAFNYATRAMKMLHLNGFAIVAIDKDGYFYTNLITAFNNKFYYNGKKYGG